MASYTPPLRITIPIPSYIPRARGRNATTGLLGGNLRFRCSDPEHELIQSEANMLGDIPVATFARWCTVHVARELKRLREEALLGEHTPND